MNTRNKMKITEKLCKLGQTVKNLEIWFSKAFLLNLKIYLYHLRLTVCAYFSITFKMSALTSNHFGSGSIWKRFHDMEFATELVQSLFFMSRTFSALLDFSVLLFFSSSIFAEISKKVNSGNE